MPGVTVSSLSTQYVLVPVRAYSAGLPYNPTSLEVQMAFLVSGKPGLSDWNAASWVSASAVNGVYYAQCLVGAQNGGADLPIATYDIWLQVTASPEVPVLISGGTLTIN